MGSAAGIGCWPLGSGAVPPARIGCGGCDQVRPTGIGCRPLGSGPAAEIRCGPLGSGVAHSDWVRPLGSVWPLARLKDALHQDTQHLRAAFLTTVVLGKHQDLKVINLFSKIRGNVISSSPHVVPRKLWKMFSFLGTCLPSGATGDRGTERVEGDPVTPQPPGPGDARLRGPAFGTASQRQVRSVDTAPSCSPAQARSTLTHPLRTRPLRGAPRPQVRTRPPQEAPRPPPAPSGHAHCKGHPCHCVPTLAQTWVCAPGSWPA